MPHFSTQSGTYSNMYQFEYQFTIAMKGHIIYKQMGITLQDAPLKLGAYLP